MILLIDNYDSFSYNLYQLIGMIRPDIRVIRNDEMTIAEIEALAPDHIIVSPGPGRPKDAGICEEVIDYFKGKIPIFGGVSRTSGNLRDIRRRDRICEEADAWKDVHR